MKTLCLALGLIIIAIPPVHARMYQWVDPDSGTTQLSGKPPSWYRTGKVGPRIFVFENGKIVDDTAVVLSEDHRILMRKRAFIEADKELEKARERFMESSRQRAEEAAKRKSTAREDEEEIADRIESAQDEVDTAMTDPAADVDEERPQPKMTVEDMRELIEEWERQQEEQAREIIGNQ